MKLRFSLRTLMILVTCAAALCWWRDRPRRMANEFVEAVEAGRYDVADSLFRDSWGQSLVEFMERDERNRMHARRRSQSPGQWLKGECRVELTSVDFQGLGGDVVINLLATNRGMRHGFVVEPAKPVQFDGGLMINSDISR